MCNRCSEMCTGMLNVLEHCGLLANGKCKKAGDAIHAMILIFDTIAMTTAHNK